MKYNTKEDALELIRTFLPKYLTPKQQESLFSVVKENFPSSNDPNLIYSNLLDINYFHQGDGLIDVPFAQFNNGRYISKYLKGAIISNTCDISIGNERLDDPFVQFSAIFSLEEYITVLKENKISQERINSFIQTLKNNRISNLFYLPEKKNGAEVIMEESFIRFDLNVSLPISLFEGNFYNKEYLPKGDRLFSFSNYGFYLFLIKLSIHYCRFREGVFRNA